MGGFTGGGLLMLRVMLEEKKHNGTKKMQKDRVERRTRKAVKSSCNFIRCPGMEVWLTFKKQQKIKKKIFRFAGKGAGDT